MIVTFALMNDVERLKELSQFLERTMPERYTIDYGTRYTDEISVFGKPYRLSSKMEPTMFTIVGNEEIQTMFRLAFGDIIIYEQQSIDNEKAICSSCGF